MLTINDVFIFDTETTGIPKKGQTYEKDFLDFPHIVSLAWSYKGKEKHYIIKPDGWEIPDEAAKVHGISTEIALKHGEDLDNVLLEFFHDASDSVLVCAHNIYFDTSIIKADCLRTFKKDFFNEVVEPALHKEKRIDTMMKTIKFVNAKYPDGRGGKWPKLEELYEKLFPGETFDAHDALEDVLALKRCLPELVKLGIIELKPKEYPTEETKGFKSTKTKVKEITNLGKSAGISSDEFKKRSNSILDEDNF